MCRDSAKETSLEKEPKKMIGETDTIEDLQAENAYLRQRLAEQERWDNSAERKQIEAELNKLYRAMQQSPASIVITDTEGTIEYVNPKFTQVTGYTLEEAIGQNPRVLKSGLMPETGYRELWEMITAGHEWRGEFHNKKKNGEVFWEAASISPIINEEGVITHFVAVKEDITERKRTEDALRTNLQLLETLLHTIPCPVFYKDKEGRYLGCNRLFAEQIRGVTEEEIIGHTLYDLPDSVPPELAEMYYEQDARLIREGGKQSFEVEIPCADGVRRNYILSRATFPDSEGNVAGIVGAMLDVTELRQAHRQVEAANIALQQSNNSLEHRVAQRTAELLELNTALERFVPHQLLRLLNKSNIIDVQLGDQVQRNMTILFSDVRDFTSLSEQMTPQENFNFINSYLSRVSPIIREHNGYIDKYIGDAIMALFPETANDALCAAIEMCRAVTLYNTHRATYGYRPISIGIGLHTGSVMLGVIGEAERIEGTVISDAVNLAARLEGITRLYGASIVISEQMLFSTENPNRYTFRFLDKVKVKGKQDPVSVFEILDGYPEAEKEIKIITRQDFEKGLLHYHSQEFDRAMIYFQNVLAIDESDKAAMLYLQRATHFLTHGVPIGWEGIEALSEK